LPHAYGWLRSGNPDPRIDHTGIIRGKQATAFFRRLASVLQTGAEPAGRKQATLLSDNKDERIVLPQETMFPDGGADASPQCSARMLWQPEC